MRFINRSKWRNFVILGLIISLALLLRVGFVHIILIEHGVKEAPVRADAEEYIKYGYNIAYRGVYSLDFPSPQPKPDSYRSPGFPIFIALAMRLTKGLAFIPMTLYVQALLGTLTVLVTYLVAKRFMSGFMALLPALLVALSPHLVVMAGYFLTETLSGFLLALALLFFIQALECHRNHVFAVSGLLFGYGYLTNETYLFLPILLSFLLILKSTRPPVFDKRIMGSVAVFLFFFSVFPAVWMTRNFIRVQDASRTGINRAIQTMSHGAYPGFIYNTPEYKYYPYLEDPLQPRFGTSIHAFAEILWQRVRERPARYLSWYLLEKPYYFWSWNILQGEGDVFVYPIKTSLYHENRAADMTKAVMHKMHPWILLLFIAGPPALFLRRRHSDWGFVMGQSPVVLFVVCGYFTLIYTIFAPWPRYSIILRPELYVCAVWSLKAYLRLIERT